MQLEAGPIDTRNQVTAAPGPNGGDRGQPSTDPGCLEETCRILQEHDLATAEELAQLRSHGRAPLNGPRPWDPIEFLAALRVRDPDARPQEIERVGRSLAEVSGLALALIPFANRLPTPSAFYDVHKSLHQDCKRLMAPVLYAEEAEVIGIGSISPVALKLAEARILEALGERTGTRPIISKLLLHHEGWLSLCQKQFEL